MPDLYLGTRQGVYRLVDSEAISLGLENERISAIYAAPENGGVTLLAGSYGNGMFRSQDGGKNWSAANDGLTGPAIRCIVPDPLNEGAILAGTEPARLFRSQDGGSSWRELDGIARIDGHDKWFLPYSPRAGALRNVYAPPGSTRQLFGSVEVGGLLRSEDGGVTWTCSPVIKDEDIHQITGHPDKGSLMYASLGYASLARSGRYDGHDGLGGVARSRDGGQTWQKIETHYTRSTIIPPGRPDLILAGPAPTVGKGGRIVVSSDGGDTWTPASDGIDTPMPDMVEHFVAGPNGTVWAICSEGRLLWSRPDQWHWQSALPAGFDRRVEAIAFAAEIVDSDANPSTAA